MSKKPRVPNLMDEYPLLVFPSLAEAMGINKAVVFQQLNFLLHNQKTAKNDYTFVKDRWWVYNSYEEWHDSYFTWLAPRTLKAIFTELESSNLVITMQSVKNKSDRRKWYTINYEEWDKYRKTIGQKMSHQPSDIKSPMVGQEMSDGYSETSSETISEENSANAPKSISTDRKLPKRTSKFTRPYIVAYSEQCGTNTNLLVSAWYGVGSHSSITTLANYDAQAFIETCEELELFHIGTDEYLNFTKHVKETQHWQGRKNQVQPNEMRKCITSFKERTPAQAVDPNKPMTQWEYDWANIQEQQKREAELYGRS